MICMMHRFPKCAISLSKFSFFWRLFLSESSRQVPERSEKLWEAFSNISRCRGVRRLLSGTHTRCWIGERDPDTMNQLIWYWWASQNRRCPRAKATIFTAFLRKYFFKKMLFLDNFWLLKPPKTKKGGYPPPPFHILNFKIFTKSKTWQFLGLETRPGRHFLMVFTMFFAPP